MAHINARCGAFSTEIGSYLLSLLHKKRICELTKQHIDEFLAVFPMKRIDSDSLKEFLASLESEKQNTQWCELLMMEKIRIAVYNDPTVTKCRCEQKPTARRQLHATRSTTDRISKQSTPTVVSETTDAGSVFSRLENLGNPAPRQVL